MESVCAPGLLSSSVVSVCHLSGGGRGKDSLPDVFLAHQARPVTSPIASRPSRALIEKLDPIFKGCLNLTLIFVLNPGLPLVTDQPTSHKIVVVGVEDPLPPFLVLETMEEIVTRKNLGPVGTGSTRHARSPAVHVMSCRDLKVAALDVSRAQPIPELGRPISIPLASNSLASAHASNLWVLKWCEDPWHQCRWPSDIIIGHDCNWRFNLGERLADLNSLIGNCRSENSDLGIVECRS